MFIFSELFKDFSSMSAWGPFNSSLGVLITDSGASFQEVLFSTGEAQTKKCYHGGNVTYTVLLLHVILLSLSPNFLFPVSWLYTEAKMQKSKKKKSKKKKAS